MKQLAIIGYHDGDAGQISTWLEGEYNIACYVNPSDRYVDVDSSTVDRAARCFSYPTRNSFKQKKLINSSTWDVELRHLGIKFVLVAISNPLERERNIKVAHSAGFTLVNAIHPSVIISEDVAIEENVILYPKVFVGYRAELHTGAVVNTGSQVDHHNVLHANCTIDPGVTFAGNVVVHSLASVHTGVVAKNRLVIGRGSIVGAGAVLIDDVPDNVTVVGVPAKIIKKH